jgi:hypothetical protein
MPAKKKRGDPNQSERFIETARKIGADESGKKFEKAFKTMALGKTTSSKRR